MAALRTFYSLILTQIVSLIGSRMTGIAVGIFVFDQTGDAAPLLIAAFFAEIPGTVLGSLTGILADRFDRRTIIMLGDAGQALATLGLLVAIAGDGFAVWQLYLASLLQGIFALIQEPASQATITQLVPPDQRDRANGIREIGFPLAGVFAPIFAGLLYALGGVILVMVLDLLTFAVAVVVVLLIHIPPPEPDADDSGGSLWRAMWGGWRFFGERRALLVLALTISAVWFLINGPLGAAIPYLTLLTDSEATVGILLSMMNLGAFLGASLLAVVGNVRHRVPMIGISFAWLGGMFILYGMVRHPVLLGMVLVGLFFPLPIVGALFNTLLQNITPPALQGRVFAVTGQIFMLATPLSFLATGFLIDDVLEPAVGSGGWERVAPVVGQAPGAGMGLLMLLVGLLIWGITALVFAFRAIRHLESDLTNAAANS